MVIKRRSLHIVPVSHMPGFCFADGVTVDCWWRHNDQIIVTRSHKQRYIIRYINIDFIRGDIHGRSCKIPKFQLPHNDGNLWQGIYWNVQETSPCLFSSSGEHLRSSRVIMWSGCNQRRSSWCTWLKYISCGQYQRLFRENYEVS